MFFRFHLCFMVGSGQFDRIRPKGSDPAPSPQHCWLANVNKSKMGGSPTNGIETVRVYCQGVIGIIPENTYYSLPTSNKNNTLYLVPKYIFVWFPAIKHNVVHV